MHLGGPQCTPLTAAAVATSKAPRFNNPAAAAARRAARVATGVQSRGQQGCQLVAEHKDVLLAWVPGPVLDQRWAKGYLVPADTAIGPLAIPKGAKVLEVRTNVNAAGEVSGSYVRFGVF